MWNYCPSCASLDIQFDGYHRFSCPARGFVYYHNTADATGCVIRGILFLNRDADPDHDTIIHFISKEWSGMLEELGRKRKTLKV
jgi:hypothetical protein